MWYAILDMFDNVEVRSWLLYGTLEEIAKDVTDLCEYNNPNGDGPFDFDQLYKDNVDYDAEDYCTLKEDRVITPEVLEEFTFIMDTIQITVHCLAKGYAAFKDAFDGYDGENDWLALVELPDHIDPDEEEAFAEEFAEFLQEDEYMDPDSDKEWTYIRFDLDED